MRVLAGAVVLAAVVAGVVATRHQATALARVRAALLDDHHFVNGPTAGATLADASQLLFEDGKTCEAKRGADDPRCDARLSAAAFTSVAAVGVGSCTAPGVYRTRTSLVAYVDAIDAFDHRPLGTMRVPAPPRVPQC